MKGTLFTLVLTLIFSFQINAQESAETILDNALSKAKVENKNVFIKFEASWCGWCKKMTKYIKSEKLKPLFNDNYVLVPLVVMESKKNIHLENPGGIDVLKKYKGEQAGLPFWVILDAEGNLIGDSFDEKGQNLGCPVSVDEVVVFTETLRKTSKLSEAELAQIADTFREK